MDVSAIMRRSMLHERERIRFLETHRGAAAARAFAEQTHRVYRRAVLRRAAPTQEAIYRIRFIGSYCYLKRYLARSASDTVDAVDKRPR